MSGISLPNKGLKLQKIRRLLLLAEKYITSIEVLFDGKRSIVPHAASFYGRPITIQIKFELPRRDEFELESHTNESIGDVKKRIADKMKLDVGQLTIVSVNVGDYDAQGDEGDNHFADNKLVYQVTTEFCTEYNVN